MSGVMSKGQKIDSQKGENEAGGGNALRLPSAVEALEQGFVVA
jgi:hypothetical protein